MKETVASSVRPSGGCLAHVAEHTVGPEWNIDRDLCPAQLSEGLCIQNQEESTFLLDTETRGAFLTDVILFSE